MTSSDLAADCVALDAAETVELWLRRSDGIIVVPVAGALRRAMAQREQDCDGVRLAAGETIWHIPGAPLPANQEILPGDSIVQGNITWAVSSATLETLGTRWRCVCTRVT